MTSHREKSPIGGVLIAIALFALVASAFVGLAPVSAQDASPVATECVSPGLPPGSPTPEEEMAPEASPEAMEGMDMGSPVAMATPEPVVAPELPEGTPADEATTAAIDAALANYAACFHQGGQTGDYTLVAALHTENFLLNETGSTNPYDWVAGEEEGDIQSVELLSTGNHMTYDDGRVGADIQVLLNDVWQTGFREFLAQGADGTWLLDEEVQISADPDVEAKSVTGANITEIVDEATGAKTYEFTWLGTQEIAATDAIVLTIGSAATNTEAHEAIVFILPEGADPMGLLDGTIPFEEVQFLGGVWDVYPGQSRDMAFHNLAPGTYTIVCFFPGPDGMPHIANGMHTTFTVTEPAA